MSARAYTYVLVRQDIPRAQQAVQACHAALEAGFRFDAPAQTSFLVLCGVPDEASLKAWAQECEASRIGFEMFFEPDNAMGYSALATEPLVLKAQRKRLAKLPLLQL